MIDDVRDLFEPTCPKSAFTKAQFVLSRLEKTGRIRYVGALAEHGMGRKKHCYCCRPIKNLFHEWGVGQVLKAFGWPECNTGSEVDKDLLPDAELFLGTNKYFLEFDTGSIRRVQFVDRVKCYDEVSETVLFVTTSVGRMNDLLRWSHDGLFSTLEQLKSNPFGDIWTSPDGRVYAIQNPLSTE